MRIGRHARSINVYVWPDVPNWGDRLGRDLIAFFLPRYEVIAVNHIDEADIVGIGSVLHHVPSDWSGIIAGTGRLYQSKRPPHPYNATVLGVRGYRSLPAFEDVTIGDPGLIAPLIYSFSSPSRSVDIGLLPHWSDTNLRHDRRFYGEWTTKTINPFQRPREVIEQMRCCKKIVTSSLHGVILSDALGIPRRMVPAWSMMNNPDEGGLFKFDDYQSSISGDISAIFEPDKLVVSNPDKIKTRQNALISMYKSLADYF